MVFYWEQRGEHIGNIPTKPCVKWMGTHWASYERLW
jgi:hypothetical protein